MNSKELDKVLCDAYYEEEKRKLSTLPSDEELLREFPITKEKREKFVKRVYKKKKPVYIIYLQRAAAFLLILSAITFGAMMLNPEIRADMLEKGIELFDKYIQFDFGEDKSDYKVDFDNIEIGYIPEGYELFNSSIFDNSHYYTYTNDKGHGISISINGDMLDDNTMLSDSFVNVEPISIDGFNGYSSYNENDKTSIVIWGNEHFQIYIVGEFPLEEALKVAYNIKY